MTTEYNKNQVLHPAPQAAVIAEQNKALERKFSEEAWNNGDLAVVDELVAPDFVDHAAPPGLPPGAEGHKVLIKLYREAFPGMHLTINELLADGDKVIVRWAATGTHLGPLFGIPPTGKKINVDGIGIRRYSDGKMVVLWNVFDQMAMMQQLGLIPTPNAPATK